MDIIRAARLVPAKAQAQHPLDVGMADLLLLSTAITEAEDTPLPRSIRDATRRRKALLEKEERIKQAYQLLGDIVQTTVGRERRNQAQEAEDSDDGLSFIAKAAMRKVASTLVRFAGFLARGAIRILMSAMSAVVSAVTSTIAFLVANPAIALVAGLVALGFYGWYRFKHRDDDIKDVPGTNLQTQGIPMVAANEPMVARPAKSVGLVAPEPKPAVTIPAQGLTSSGDARVTKAAAGSLSAAIDFFEKTGWTRAQAAGIAANLHCESALKPDAKGDYVGGNPTAYGIAQWHKDRRSKFEQIFGKPIVGTSVEEQMTFVDWELRNTEGLAGKKLRSTTTAQEAGAVVSLYYERPADKLGEANKRGALAERLVAGTAVAANASTMIPQSTADKQTSAQAPVKKQTQLASAAHVASPQQGPGDSPVAKAPSSTGGAVETPVFIKRSKKEPFVRMAA